MDLRDFQILIDLYEHKNLTKVANIHYISQPAVTKRIQNVENKLNCQLIIRSNKGILFTSFGENIIPHCRKIVLEYNSLKSSINDRIGIVSGSINILSSQNYSRYRLPSVLRTYSQLYPFVDVKITTEKSRNIYSMILEDNSYIGIVRTKHYKWEGVDNLLLSKEPMCLIYSLENANRNLLEYNYISHDLDININSQIERWAFENNISLNKSKFCVDDIISCKKMVENGLGWSIVPQLCLPDFKGVMQNLYFNDGTPFSRDTYMLYHSSYYKLQQVKLFIDVLIENENQYQQNLNSNKL